MSLGLDDIVVFRPGVGLTEADLPYHIVKPGGSIQNAVTAAADGRAIWIWPGTYNIAATIAVPHPVRIMGTGRDTVIFAQAAMNLLPIFQVAAGVAEFWISDLRLNGAAATFPDFIDFAGAAGTVIVDNIETHALMRGFITSAGVGITSLLIDHSNVSGGLDLRESNVNLRDSTFTQIGAGPGYLFTSAAAHEYRVSRCHFSFSAANPLTITTASPGCFACVDSRFYGDTPVTITDGEVSFEGCNFTDAIVAGAELRIEGGFTRVTNSHLRRAATFGAGAADIQLSNNEIAEDVLEWAGGGGQWIIQGNIFRTDGGTQAIQLIGGDRHTVIGNTILSSANPAIDIQADDTTVVGNTLVTGGTINDGGANNVMGLNRIGA